MPVGLGVFFVAAGLPGGDFICQGLFVGNAPVKVAIEAAVRFGWDAVIGPDGEFIGMHGFGASAPAKDLFKHFGITAEATVNAALKRLG